MRLLKFILLLSFLKCLLNAIQNKTAYLLNIKYTGLTKELVQYLLQVFNYTRKCINAMKRI